MGNNFKKIEKRKRLRAKKAHMKYMWEIQKRKREASKDKFLCKVEQTSEAAQNDNFSEVLLVACKEENNEVGDEFERADSQEQNDNFSEVLLVACKEENNEVEDELERADSQEQKPNINEISVAVYEEDDSHEVGEKFERDDSLTKEEKPNFGEVPVAAYEEDGSNEVGDEFKWPDSPPQEQQVLVVRRQLCRGCLSDGAFCSLQSTTGGESYASLLQTYCNIELCRVQSEALRAICAQCAARLREARAFSEQARAAEARFAALYAQGRVRALVDDGPGFIKEEISYSNDEDTEVTTGNLSLIIEEPNRSNKDAKTKPKKRDAKVPKGESPNKKKPQKKRKTEQKQKSLAYESFERVGSAFKCKLCGKLQPHKSLSRHLWNHERLQKERSCNVCEKTFATPLLAREHRLQEHAITDMVQCKACDKSVRKRCLKDHMNNFHKLGVRRQCPQCDYVGYTKPALRKHLLVHKTEKEYHCSYCKKSFMRDGTLRMHERIHTGERNKVCAECGQAFVQRASLKYHMEKHHPGVKF